MTNRHLSAKQHLGVMGSPIAHSVSPTIHAAAYEVMGLDWDYSKRECTEDELSGVLESLADDWLGLSLTMPLKAEARRIADRVDPLGRLSGVVNTIRRTSDGWNGWNTDIQGLARVMNESGASPEHTLVVGTGATAVSAVLAAFASGANRVSVWGRRDAAVENLVEKFDGLRSEQLGESPWVQNSEAPERVLALGPAGRDEWISHDTSLIVSTVPGPAGEDLHVPAAAKQVPLIDVAYNPWPSPLAKQWTAAGGSAHSGLAMLLYQALLQIRTFVSGDVTKPLLHEDDVLHAMRNSLHMER